MLKRNTCQPVTIMRGTLNLTSCIVVYDHLCHPVHLCYKTDGIEPRGGIRFLKKPDIPGGTKTHFLCWQAKNQFLAYHM